MRIIGRVVRSLWAALPICLLAGACRPEVTESVPTLIASQDILVSTIAPDETPTEEPSVNTAAEVICGMIYIRAESLFLENLSCEQFPENNPTEGMLFEIYPAHDEIHLLDFPESSWHQARVIVYPLAEFSMLQPDRIHNKVWLLSEQIAGRSLEKNIALLPMFNAMQIFHSHVKLLESGGSRGVRFVTMYTQWTPPINNEEIFYAYQGLSADGQHWISVLIPVTHAMLPADDTISGVDPRTWAAGWRNYLDEILPQLEAQPDDSFAPSLLELDKIVMDIQVLP